jgi:uncharacterized protein
MDMTKFKDADDSGFIAVAGEIRRWSKELAKAVGNPHTSIPDSTASRDVPLSSPSLNQIVASATLESTPNTSPDERKDDASQITPMAIAIQRDDEQTVEMLLNAGVPPDQPCYGAMPPLCIVGVTGNVKIAKLLLDSGAEIDAWKEKPLFAAATKGHLELVKFLLERGAHPDAAKPDRWTALHTALVTRHPEIAEVLINAGADVNSISIIGATPLMIAADGGFTRLVSILLEKGAKTEPVNPQGFTALKLAMLGMHQDMAWELIKAGAKA